jgi:hypothetical protein
MTRLLPFTCSSVPFACSSPAHPPTAVRTDPAQQLNVVAGTVVTGGEGHRTGIPVRIVHL